MPKANRPRLIRIEATFGSGIQHDVSMMVLKQFLEAWKANVEAANRKNSVRIDYGARNQPSVKGATTPG